MRRYQKKRLPTHQNELTPAKGVKVQEETIEEQQKKEEACDIRLPVLTKHLKKSSKLRKIKKRCWVCKQPGHLKRKCQYQVLLLPSARAHKSRL